MEASKEPTEPGSADAHTAPTLQHWVGLERRWLGALALLAIGLLVALSAGLLLVQRQATLDLARAQSLREVKRLAAELEQSLQIAQALVAEETGTTTPSSRHGALPNTVVRALSLPFDLQRLPLNPLSSADLPQRQWVPGLVQQDQGKGYVPLRWREPGTQGAQDYELRLSSDALLARFASEDLPKTGSMSLFRIEDSGATTILVRHPQVAGEQGLTVFGHVAAAVARQPSGVIQVQAVIDGVERVVGYQRLSGAGQRMMVVYALPVKQVLAVWSNTLPMALALTVMLGAAMAYGAWRLDRSLQALRRSERHFQTLTGHLPDVVARYDRQGCLLYANAAFEQATGRPPASLIGQPLGSLGAPESIHTAWAECLERVFTTGQTETLYFSHAGPGGMRHWEAQARLEPRLPGDDVTVLVVTRDITERHVAEARRLSAQQLFESVFQAAPEAMSLGDWDSGRLLLVNDAFCQLFGLPRDRIIGATSTELGLWHQPENRQRLLAALAKGDKVRDARGQSRRPDGTEIHVRYSAERVAVDGQARLLLMFRDVTQLELDQRNLARSELRFRLASSHGQVWEWDFGQGFVTPSNGFFVALGHPSPLPSQMGAQFLDLIHPEDRPRLRTVLRRFLKNEGEYQLEFRARDAQGRYRWFDTRGSGLRDASGRVTYMAGTTFDISDRKAVEEAQRQTLVQLETVANASPALIWTSGKDKRADWFNGAWLEFTGRTLEQELGEGWLEGMHPEDHDLCMSTYVKAFDAREPFSMEHRLRHNSGEYRWLLEQGRPRYDADNRFIGYIGSCLDLTELRQAEATARERGAMLEQVFDVLQDMLFVVDEQERFVFYQAGSSDRLYRPPNDFLGQRLNDVLPIALTERLREAMARARQLGLQEIDYHLDLPVGLRHFNARLAWLAESGQCMFVVRDVTDQRASQREGERLNAFVLLLFRLANRFINLPVQEADDAIHEALGDMGRFVDADRAYLFNYELSAETASNTHEWCDQGVTPAIDDLQNIPFSMIPDWFIEHSQGHVMHVPDVQALPEGPLRDFLEPQGIQSLMALPLMHGERCLGFVGLDSVRHTHNYGEEETTLLRLFAQMLVNIRLRVEAEEKIQALTEGLESKVAERTLQLETSVQQLQAVNRELESFTYSASHDLRTPLRGIEGFSSLLLDEHAAQLDEQGREYLHRIQKATLHMAQLVNDLLAYSRLQQLTGRPEPMNLAACVHSVAGPFLDELETRHGRLHLLMSDDLLVQANPQGMAIVLRNLLDNALKFTPAERAPQIRIEAHPRPGFIEICVADNGQGFDMRYHDRIFGMFQRLHRQDQIPGTGIGLALVSKAVERMGGRIWATSSPDKGSEFRFTVPQSDALADETAARKCL